MANHVRRGEERPRDELGRPLPWGSENRLTLEDFDALSLEENHRRGVEHFNARRYFPAHEAWEAAWKMCRGTRDEQFFHGLAQLGAAYTHVLRGNAHGAATLAARARKRLVGYQTCHLGIEVSELLRWLAEDQGRFEDAEGAGEPPTLDGPRVILECAE